MEYVNVSLPWMPDYYATVPRLVEKQLKTEQVGLHPLYISRIFSCQFIQAVHRVEKTFSVLSEATTVSHSVTFFKDDTIIEY